MDIAPYTTIVKELRRREYLARVARLRDVTPQKLIPKSSATTSMHVVYVMTHVEPTGGAKIVFEHANRLQREGVHVSIVSHFPRPKWYSIECDYIQVPFQVELASGIPKCDVIVATYWDHIQSCVETGIAPVVYFEQGDFHLYEELDADLHEIIRRQLQSAAFVTTVSSKIIGRLRSRFGREATVFHNAVDRNVFFPATSLSSRANKPYLLMIGSDALTFKGTADVLEAHRLVREAGYDLDLVWVSPQPLKEPAGTVYIRPDQHVLGDLYRHAAVYVSGSHYETFPLPPLEAMACGCPVVSTANVGILEYAEDGENCLLAEIQKPESLANQIIRLFEEPELRERLKEGGLRTSERFNWDTIIDELRAFYEYVASMKPEPRNSLLEWDILPPNERFLDPDGSFVLEQLLLQTEADIIQAPVVYKLFEEHYVARWEIIATRRQTTTGKEQRAYLPLKGLSPKLPYAIARDYFVRGQYEEALKLFVRHYQDSTDDSDKALYLRWIVLCLLELGRDSEALDVLRDAVRVHAENTDLLYLQAIALKLAACSENIGALLHVITLIGESAAFPEFFYGIEQLSRDHLTHAIDVTSKAPS